MVKETSACLIIQDKPVLKIPVGVLIQLNICRILVALLPSCATSGFLFQGVQPVMLFRKEDSICPPNSPESITGFFQNHPYIADRRGAAAGQIRSNLMHLIIYADGVPLQEAPDPMSADRIR